MRLRSPFHLARIGTIAVALAAVIASGSPPGTASAAPPALTVNGLNHVYGSDAATTAGFAWQTARTASSSAAQPVTQLAIAPVGEFSAETAPRIPATTTVDDRVSFNTAQVTDLRPGTEYNYAIVDDGTGATTETYSFRTAPAATDAFSFIALADADWRSTSSYENHWGPTLDAALAADPDAAFVLHSGDAVSYQTADRWDGFFSLAVPELAQHAFIPTAAASGSENKQYCLRFALPCNKNDSLNSSFVYGDLLVLNVNDTSSSSTTAKETAAWIAAEVAEKGTKADGQPRWVIASISGSFFGATSASSTVRTTLTQAFDQAGVSLVLQGDSEAYVRSFPVKGTTPVSDYPSSSTIATGDGRVYLSPGASGAEQVTPSSSSSQWAQVVSSFGSSGLKTAAENKMYSSVEVAPDALTVTARTAAGTQVDSFVITNAATLAREPNTSTPLALTNTFGADAATQRSFSWQTDNTLTGASVDVVEAGTPFESPATRHVTGSSAKTPSVLSSQNSHRAELSGLAPGTTYSYRLGNSSTNTKTGTVYQWYSPTYEFTTEPGTDGEFTFLDLADSQGGSDSYSAYWGNTLSTALKRVPDAPFVMHNGDMVDAVTSSQLTNWFSAVGTSLATPAFYPVLGNHEGTSHNSMYQSLFGAGNENGYTLNYSFSYGNALFVNLNSNYTSSSDLKKQGTWLQNEVAAKGAGKFVIVTFHKGPYGGAHTSDSDVKSIKEHLVPVLEQAGVDLVLQGHDHNYIRSYPIKNSTPNTAITWNRFSSSADGIPYLVPRNSGEKTYSLTSTSSKPWINVLWNPESLAKVPEGDVYSAVTVGADAITVKSYTVSGLLIDSFTVTQ